MESNQPSALTVFGFMTVVDLPEIGASGGMLILNQWGRPIEFHCSAPLAPNRTQQVLYGHTLRSYLFCDQIGPALLEQAKKSPQILLVDMPELLGLQAQTELPLVFVSRTPEVRRVPCLPGRVVFQLALDDWALLGIASPDLESALVAACQAFSDQLPLDEPFERIRGAIEEAHAVSR